MWKQGTTDGHYWQAKVFADPSQYGIGGGRVSILAIYAGDRMTPLVYRWERGPDLNMVPDVLLVAVLEDATK